ncbi:hypothetical protein Fcan01_19680 [Folsomia candida]|uniref:Uncharacterized protein n=1 Tax=Folsomia candida TaxID=158441 RepID=A0A226DLT7_FOLCA|nr:hypothetical protein Fcan01_19680 [Folsomia candida]
MTGREPVVVATEEIETPEHDVGLDWDVCERKQWRRKLAWQGDMSDRAAATTTLLLTVAWWWRLVLGPRTGCEIVGNLEEDIHPWRQLVGDRAAVLSLSSEPLLSPCSVAQSQQCACLPAAAAATTPTDRPTEISPHSRRLNVFLCVTQLV